MKELYFDTNFNGKLDQGRFLHVTTAAGEMISESQLNEPMMVLCKDESHAPVKVMIVDLFRVRLDQIPGCCTWASHAMHSHEFREWWHQKYPGCKLDVEMAVYYFERIVEQ